MKSENNEKPKKVTMAFSIPPEYRDKIEADAKADRRTPSFIIGDIVRGYYDKKKS